MGYLVILLFAFVGLASAQNSYRVCIAGENNNLCQTIGLDDSKVICDRALSRIDCALRLARNQADLAVFTEEEIVLLGQQQPNNHQVIANVKHQSRNEEFAYETVAVVNASYTGGLEGLRDSGYCHPGFDQTELRWSPRTLRALEQRVARTDRCPDADASGKTYEELEVAQLSSFFRAACRPGAWSRNATIDANLKRQYPNLCALCNPSGSSESCVNSNGYTYDMGVQISEVNNNNRHIQALECLVKYGGNVSYVAWQHVREYFLNRAADATESYALLCEDGTTRQLNGQVISSGAPPCSWVRQPWKAIVASTATAAQLQTEMRDWFPSGLNPNDGKWRSQLFNYLTDGTGQEINFLQTSLSAQNYTISRSIPDLDAITTCMPARRWCTISQQEQEKCSWIRRAAHTLGIEPSISCQHRENVFQCMRDIKDSRADFISLDSNYGYMSRVNYNLVPVKILQNDRSMPNSLARIAALVKTSASQTEITRFENLRGKKACFPEFGGLAFVAFIKTAHERGIVSETECDYSRAVGEYFAGACAPGALDPTHTISTSSSFNNTALCSVCQNAIQTGGQWSNFTCAADYSNKFYSTNGTLACLNDPNSDVAFLEIQNLQHHFGNMSLDPSNYRALCRNNSLAVTNGIAGIDDNCLLALVVDAEVLARRNDEQFNSLASLLELLDRYFGYNAVGPEQLINLLLFSAFDGVNDLLFKDTAVGLSEPSAESTHIPARNYFELFRHLEQCNSSANLASGLRILSFMSVLFMFVTSRWIL